jgi:autophagy-related protein 17
MASPQPPPADSPLSGSSTIDPRTVSLDELVGIFLASKRSLSCIDQVRRARSIVEEARDAVEANAVIHAKTVFLHTALDDQVDRLHCIGHFARSVESEGNSDLQVRQHMEIWGRLMGNRKP